MKRSDVLRLLALVSMCIGTGFEMASMYENAWLLWCAAGAWSLGLWLDYRGSRARHREELDAWNRGLVYGYLKRGYDDNSPNSNRSASAPWD